MPDSQTPPTQPQTPPPVQTPVVTPPPVIPPAVTPAAVAPSELTTSVPLDANPIQPDRPKGWIVQVAARETEAEA